MTEKRSIFSATKFEIRSSGSKNTLKTIVGYGSVWNALSIDFGGWVERYMEGCYTRTLLNYPSIMGFWAHDSSQVLARTDSGTMRVTQDSTGLLCEYDIPDTNLGRDLLTLVERGDVTGLSVGYWPDHASEKWTKENDQVINNIYSVAELMEVSLCSKGAIPAAQIINVRSDVSAASAGRVIRKRPFPPSMPAQYREEILNLQKRSKPVDDDKLDEESRKALVSCILRRRMT